MVNSNSTLKNRAKSAAGDHDECPEEYESTRIRAFLAKVKPLEGCTIGESDEYWEGRSLIERLALAREVNVNAKGYHWDAIECATVLHFLHSIQPVKGTCFCHDDSRVNATCGFHAILEFARDEVRRMAPPKPKARKRTSSAAVQS